MRVKIYGAGSVGNHLAHACRCLGWQVAVCDISQVALERMKNEIYPSRYGRWDKSIQLYNKMLAPIGGFDVILIGTPPPSHLRLALEALAEKPRAILVEKPLCKPNLEGADEFCRAIRDSETRLFVGYNHVVGKATRKAEELLKAIGEVQTLDVEFRECWAGIFDAHPWLTGPSDSYLGFWEFGGGASGEYSHAVNLWQHFAHIMDAGRVVEVDAMLNYIRDDEAEYDDLCLLHLQTERGLVGCVAQDLVTTPPRKRAKIQGTLGAVEWMNGYNLGGDVVLSLRPGVTDELHFIPKERPDDFIEELRHVEGQLTDSAESSGISLGRGLDTMLVLAAAHRSEREECRIRIDYSKGYTLGALCSLRA